MHSMAMSHVHEHRMVGNICAMLAQCATKCWHNVPQNIKMKKIEKRKREREREREEERDEERRNK